VGKKISIKTENSNGEKKIVGNLFSSCIWQLQIFLFWCGKEGKPGSVQGPCLEGKSSENKQHGCLWGLDIFVLNSLVVRASSSG